MNRFPIIKLLNKCSILEPSKIDWSPSSSKTSADVYFVLSYNFVLFPILSFLQKKIFSQQVSTILVSKYHFLLYQSLRFIHSLIHDQHYVRKVAMKQLLYTIKNSFVYWLIRQGKLLVVLTIGNRIVDKK